jgi:hypothetical protein
MEGGAAACGAFDAPKSKETEPADIAFIGSSIWLAHRFLIARFIRTTSIEEASCLPAPYGQDS